ncbi:hypothetical protein Syun_020550 [Stephania yunnanensis]|uniref:Uncharacterized protein n=1 Tax=Stephania yunnanensis TaxID=152371 RepID=A0AAP0NNZ9_9MAGN
MRKSTSSSTREGHLTFTGPNEQIISLLVNLIIGAEILEKSCTSVDNIFCR